MDEVILTVKVKQTFFGLDWTVTADRKISEEFKDQIYDDIGLAVFEEK